LTYAGPCPAVLVPFDAVDIDTVDSDNAWWFIFLHYISNVMVSVHIHVNVFFSDIFNVLSVMVYIVDVPCRVFHVKNVIV